MHLSRTMSLRVRKMIHYHTEQYSSNSLHLTYEFELPMTRDLDSGVGTLKCLIIGRSTNR